ncbi:hypothetical protein SUDANB176_02233 [Streptomyces sp. enrichment culture]|uniref:hypothetical protein n=1 Tax=Streptomyces sp. enrichment culture TaxID=1795815 RepID=UPI003F57190B
MHTTVRIAQGAVAGAVGTTALNAATYLDMLLRGRPASSSPERTVDRATDLLGARIPGDGEQREARRSALGALMGSAAGVTAGAVLGAVGATGRSRGGAGTLAAAWALAMLAGNGPMTVLGVTDPRRWTAEDWAADVVPHLAYAVAATATLRLFRSPARRS